MCASHPPPPKLRICYSHRQACAARERCDGRALSSTSTSWCRFGQLNRRRQLHLGTPAGHTVKQMLTPRYICLTEIQAHSFILRNAIAIRDWPPQGTILCGRRGGGGGGRRRAGASAKLDLISFFFPVTNPSHRPPATFSAFCAALGDC